MSPHDVLTMYSVKAEEYFIAACFLLLFVPFWRFVNGTTAAKAVTVPSGTELAGLVADWFTVPDSLYLHPGHAWARVEHGDLVTVGMDDFAQKLVGRASIELPEVGDHLLQGERGWRLAQDSKSVDMLSPVDGTVVAVNERANANPDILSSDPYGDGWLLRVRVPRFKANSTGLLSGKVARRWMEEVCRELSGGISPELGLLAQDGGLPVEGMARSLDPVNWDKVARKFFLTEESGSGRVTAGVDGR